MKDFLWKKIGLIYDNQDNGEFLKTHASNPLALHLKKDIYRIFYCARDDKNRSSLSYIDYDIEKNKIMEDPKVPLIKFGPPDSFYSHGITVGNFWQESNETYIGFMGWQHRPNKHWRGDIGKINIKTGEVNFVMGINDHDKISLSYPFVLHEQGLYKMWYGSTINWKLHNGEMLHTINYAESTDAINWSQKGVAIPWKENVAQAFSRPSVLKCGTGYRMWYSYRSGTGTPYRIGFSYSTDGLRWKNHQSRLSVSDYGWDSDMVCYPYVFKHKKDTYMLYNGNGYGKTGFGLAKKIKGET